MNNIVTKDIDIAPVDIGGGNIEKNIASEYPGVKLTVSIGGACDEGKISQILRKADIAMYEAKIKRNSICMYEDR